VRDRELLSAKLGIENAPVIRNTPGLYASLFRNVSMFKRYVHLYLYLYVLGIQYFLLCLIHLNFGEDTSSSGVHMYHLLISKTLDINQVTKLDMLYIQLAGVMT
jgi:hypothetical protein